MRPSGRGCVFISYRREETASYAGRLYDRLGDRFGEDNIFMDVNSMAVGVDFTMAIAGAVSRCNIMFVLIGQRWIAITDSRGKRRIDNPGDFVRIEIETALQRDVWVVPVLVDGAVLPRADDLPQSLGPLVRHQALELSHAGFRSEVAPLIAAVAESLEAGPSRSAAPKVLSRGAVTQQGRWQLELLEDKPSLRRSVCRQVVKFTILPANSVLLKAGLKSMASQQSRYFPSTHHCSSIAWKP
jgi:hypothetical protein